jgi:hypothetical protein
MTKQMLLKKIHKIIWHGNDRIGQEDLFELQALIEEELCREHNSGNIRVTQSSNGFINSITLHTAEPEEPEKRSNYRPTAQATESSLRERKRPTLRK